MFKPWYFSWYQKNSQFCRSDETVMHVKPGLYITHTVPFNSGWNCNIHILFSEWIIVLCTHSTVRADASTGTGTIRNCILKHKIQACTNVKHSTLPVAKLLLLPSCGYRKVPVLTKFGCKALPVAKLLWLQNSYSCKMPACQKLLLLRSYERTIVISFLLL
jgi:hypothetical protein